MSAKDRAKAKVQQTRGRLKEGTGRTTGDRKMQTEGRIERVKGELHEAMEKVRHGAKHGAKHGGRKKH
ncbi:hypothetical protein GCM10010218_46760 [Streptomyces mashuensis]|uniref:CsbD-like domain-containing protein n=1 Tax=Streptomyces mashuensis TaxID=33904 RepID=A0A919B6D5_9ACTN|nr:CsbD family protein [Streptomyces mashuensis]GHF59857.1 hypothetical protein GCM10010218_46760 [Streptomyces mashuensis]